MEQPMYPAASKDIATKRNELAPDILDAFRSFSHQVFADGALSSRTKELVAVAVAHVTQCPYCIRSHTKRARLKGVSEQEIMEAIWVAAEMRAGGAISHSALAIDAMNEDDVRPKQTKRA
jgi:AhpD family alkylhydroperoxidase